MTWDQLCDLDRLLSDKRRRSFSTGVRTFCFSCTPVLQDRVAVSEGFLYSVQYSSLLIVGVCTTICE